MEYICNICNKNYSSYQSLWIHNKKYHNNKMRLMTSNDFKIESCNFQKTSNDFNQERTDQNDQNDQNDQIICEYCKKTFTRRNNLNYHIKNKCKEKDKIQEKNDQKIIKETLISLENKINKLEKNSFNKKPITNIRIHGNLINGNNHDSGPKQIIYKTGSENMNLLNYTEVSTIFDNEISSVIKLIELVNFSENKPENHSFCSTALESPYLSFYNTDTNSINKERKRHFFEEVICKSIQNHEILYKKFKIKFNSEKRRQIEDNIENLKMIKANSFNSKIMGEFIRKLNLISYNNRDLIQDTWTGSESGKKYDHDSDEEFMAMLLDDPETKKIIEAETNNKLNSELTSNDNETNSESDSELRPQLVFKNSKTKNKKNDDIIL